MQIFLTVDCLPSLPLELEIRPELQDYADLIELMNRFPFPLQGHWSEILRASLSSQFLAVSELQKDRILIFISEESDDFVSKARSA